MDNQKLVEKSSSMFRPGRGAFSVCFYLLAVYVDTRCGTWFELAVVEDLFVAVDIHLKMMNIVHRCVMLVLTSEEVKASFFPVLHPLGPKHSRRYINFCDCGQSVHPSRN